MTRREGKVTPLLPSRPIGLGKRPPRRHSGQAIATAHPNGRDGRRPELDLGTSGWSTKRPYPRPNGLWAAALLPGRRQGHRRSYANSRTDLAGQTSPYEAGSFMEAVDG